MSKINQAQWRVLIAAHLGWLLDGFDVMLYAFALLAIQKELALSGPQAGAIASITLLASAFGGTMAGYLADRFGRVRILILSILIYSAATALIALAQDLAILLLLRAIVGIGLGAEWSAGSVLVSESWPAAHRGKAAGFVQSGWALGYIAAALVAGWVMPIWGWRALFLLGALPALVTLWIRYSVPEPEIWTGKKASSLSATWAELRQPQILRRIALASSLSASLLFAYWGIFTWIPTFLAMSTAQGGAGLSLLRSVEGIITMQLGAFLGYNLFGYLADSFGRKRTFVTFVLAAALLVFIYGQAAAHEQWLLLLGPLLGFFGHGYFSVFGAMLSELFPTSIRATAQGFCYNSGRAVSAIAPLSMGFLADRGGLGLALASTSAFFVLAAFLIQLMPETQGKELL